MAIKEIYVYLQQIRTTTGRFPRTQIIKIMRKMTIAKVNNFFKETKGECALSVISFNRETKVREMAYGGNNCIDSFVEMANQAAKGKIVLLTDKEGWDFITEYESKNPGFITYDELLPYAIHLCNDGSKWNSKF